MIHWHRFLLGISPRSHIDFTCDLIRYLDRRLETRLWLERSAARDSTRLDSRECATCKRVWRSYVGLAGLRPLTGSDSCPAVGRRIVWPSAVRRVHSGCLYGPVAPYGTRIHTRRTALCRGWDATEPYACQEAMCGLSQESPRQGSVLRRPVATSLIANLVIGRPYLDEIFNHFS